jgi:hypothetical protein
MRVIIASWLLVIRGTSTDFNGRLLARHFAHRTTTKPPWQPGCEPWNAPHVTINRSNMAADTTPFQAWRATADSVDIRFLPFGPKGWDGKSWGRNCSWPVEFVCNVRTVAVRPSFEEMQPEGIGPGLGKQKCRWEQASSMDDSHPHHCHVYMYNLEGGGRLKEFNTQYHVWCMACLGDRDCSLSNESMIYPHPEEHVMRSREDYDQVMDAMKSDNNLTMLTKDVQLSSGEVIQGYTMNDGCQCRVSRTVTGYKEDGKLTPVTHWARIPMWKPGFTFVFDDGLAFKTMHREEHEEHSYFCMQAMVACLALILYILWSLFGVQGYVKLIHETGLATLLGLAIGYFKMLVGMQLMSICAPLLLLMSDPSFIA